MQPFRFVHAADLHIDSPFKGLLKTDDAVAKRLHEATFEAYQNLIDLCINEHADFLVIAGDVYDGADRGVRAQLRFREGLTRLSDYGIPTFVVHGNHDPLEGWSGSIRLPALVHTFGAEPEWADVRSNDQVIARIQGASYPHREVRENIAITFAAPPPDDVFSIGLLHCNVGGDPAHDDYAPCTVDDLASIPIDYWALGHVHTRRTLREHRPTIAYPGNTQGRHPNEPGERGALVVDVDGTGRVELAFRPLDVVRWETIEVAIEGRFDLGELVDAVSEALDIARSDAGGRDLIVRVLMTGRGPLHKELGHGETLSEIAEELRRSFGRGRPFVWIERISNETRAEIDIDMLAGRDDFLGAILRRAGTARDEGDEREELRAALASVFNSRRFADVLDAPDDEELSRIIDEARWELASLFEGDA
ncbi:MAG: DNA repair exonuclease [Dehalococcoidia bacterium]